MAQGLSTKKLVSNQYEKNMFLSKVLFLNQSTRNQVKLSCLCG